MAELNIEKKAQIVAEKVMQDLRDKGVFVADWIPVTEGLPKPYVEVLATTTWGDVTMAMYHPDDTWFIHEGSTNATNEDILAWMPKPERYMEEVDG